MVLGERSRSNVWTVLDTDRQINASQIHLPSLISLYFDESRIKCQLEVEVEVMGELRGNLIQAFMNTDCSYNR